MEPSRVKHSLAFLMLSALISGCATTRDAGSPYSLSEAELAVVAGVLHASLKELDSPEFTRFRAAQTPDGRIHVCGWVRDRGKYSDRPPFMGTLFAGQFVLDHVGNNYSARDYVLNRCSELGIPLS